MAKRSRTDWAVIFLAVLGIAIMAAGRIVMWAEESTPFEVVDGRTIFGAGIMVAMLSIIAAVQWKLIEFFFVAIRWINSRDDPRHAKRPPDGP